MSLYIEPCVLIANVFFAHPELNSIGLSAFRTILDHVEENLKHHNVIIDWTIDSAYADLEFCKPYFVKRNLRIHLVQDITEKLVKKVFGFGLSDQFLNELHKTILEVEIPIDDIKPPKVENGKDRNNIVDIAKLLQDSMIEFQELHSDASQESIEEYAVKKVMEFGRGIYNPQIIKAMACMERSVYDDHITLRI